MKFAWTGTSRGSTTGEREGKGGRYPRSEGSNYVCRTRRSLSDEYRRNRCSEASSEMRLVGTMNCQHVQFLWAGKLSNIMKSLIIP